MKTDAEIKLYNRLNGLEVGELELLKEMCDGVIFDKFMLGMLKDKGGNNE